ncbi:DGQHR domain-containing protein [Burkholderia gladioli]|uniref:DGQHR domain-containing protein n=1 Tax=Burkholderia gladioli TaxID=28095 RepID=UPI00163FC7D1|nr:DGQHR domain-containing protein [Burkholderia gladioli]
MPNRESFSASLVTQGAHKFYTMAIPSDILAQCCYVTNRHEDPDAGFQRVLDPKRAEDIAKYIDSGLGTIPTSIIVSAQPNSNIQYNSKKKTIEFDVDPHSFLIIDGQHRVYGFKKALTTVRVPVVIYNDLTKPQEAALFIDINTTQRAVPSELLLDIKKLAQTENTIEQRLGTLFDAMHNDPRSALLGLTSPARRLEGKISRVTFYGAVKNVLPLLAAREDDEAFGILNAYLTAVRIALDEAGLPNVITNPIFFRALFEVFRSVAQRVVDRFGRDYSVDSFAEIVLPMIGRQKKATLRSPGTSYKALAAQFGDSLARDVSL